MLSGGRMSVGFKESSRAESILTKLRKVIDRGYELRALPHTVLLNLDFYHSDLKAIMREWALESQHFTGVGEDEIRKYVLEGPQSDENLAEKVESNAY